MNENTQVKMGIMFVTAALIMIGARTYKDTISTQLQIAKERTKCEIIEKCNYINTPTVQCVEALSKALNVK